MQNNPTAPTTPPKSRGPLVRIGLGCAGVLLIACVGIGGFAFYEIWQQEQNYNAGHAAYMAANCAAAEEPLRKAASGDPGTADSDVALKAEAELQECAVLLGAEAAAGDGRPGEALLAYSELLTKYADGPLAGPALGAAQALSDSSAPADLAGVELCNSVDTLLGQQILADDPALLPPLLMACGQVYEDTDDFSGAITAYDRVRGDFPDFEPEVVQEALARAAVSEARAVGAGGLPAPQAVGSAGNAGDPVTVVIQNDSPVGLRLVFSGPDVRVEELGPCEECAKFSESDPTSCPELGPVGTYVLAPGSYDVVVKAVGDDVTPFSGSWQLDAGQEYSSCFYIVTSGS